MEEFLAYSPEDVIAENLNETDGRITLLGEQETAHLRELAAEIASGDLQISELIASLPDHRPPVSLCRGMPEETRPILEQLCRIREVWKSICLCTEIERQFHSRGRLNISDFWEETEEPEHTAHGRIVYQRNSYADSAYLRFAALLSAPRAVYTHNFGAVCEEVMRGNCEYCILPLENSTEGPLNSFARLIDHYGLKIAATCDIPTTDGSRITRFALLCRSLSAAISERLTDTRRFFDFSLPVEGSPRQEAILYAATCCGLVCNRIDSRVHRNEGVTHPITQFSFFADHGNLQAFLLYLSMEAPHYDPIGYYAHLP